MYDDWLVCDVAVNAPCKHNVRIVVIWWKVINIADSKNREEQSLNTPLKTTPNDVTKLRHLSPYRTDSPGRMLSTCLLRLGHRRVDGYDDDERSYYELGIGYDQHSCCTALALPESNVQLPRQTWQVGSTLYSLEICHVEASFDSRSTDWDRSWGREWRFREMSLREAYPYALELLHLNTPTQVSVS